ncbi:hypothetical protein [Coraliomargarita parva]|uniref:hypothetical protein n=1 Tax=Coraliomargarita parva TaxID=3014050 RepID=UPI0022B2EAC9|nr:hypothetical protein [Coraliomargarita parva]
MKNCLLICLLLPATVLSLFSENLRIADSIIVRIPDGWSYVGSKGNSLGDAGYLHTAVLDDSAGGQKLALSVLDTAGAEPGVRYPTRLVNATLDPIIKAYRDQGSVIDFDRKLLWKGECLFYYQKLRSRQGKRIELRGVIFESNGNWVNYMCLANDTVSWSFYADLVKGTTRLNRVPVTENMVAK